MVNKKAQYKIQQLSFMILAVFFFFILVGLFFVSWQSRGLTKNAYQLEQEKVISFLKVVADSTELNCNSNEDWCIDKDKIKYYLHDNNNLAVFSSLSSIEILKIYPSQEIIECPADNCNYYKLYSKNTKNIETHSAYVTLCEQIKKNYENCELAKLIIGVRQNE